MPKLILILTAALACQVFLIHCQKVENTTPRYNKDACLICSPFGHEADAGKCSFCKGTSVCQFCKGKGKRLEGRKDHFYEAVCAFCGGSGKCHYCKGAGRCAICKGTGKYFPLRPADGKGPAPDTASPGGIK